MITTEKIMEKTAKQYDELYKELKKEENPATRKYLYREMIKCNNVRIICLLKFAYDMTVYQTKENVKRTFGKNNAFFDYLKNKMDYELDEDDIECLQYAFSAFVFIFLDEFNFFLGTCHKINRQLERIEYKYVYK